VVFAGCGLFIGAAFAARSRGTFSPAKSVASSDVDQGWLGLACVEARGCGDRS